MDILAMSQAQVALSLIQKTLGFAPEEKYVDFTYKQDTSVPADSICKFTMVGRDKTPLGEPGRWAGTKTIATRRALLKKAGTTIALRVPYSDGASLNDMLLALYKYHNFQVSVEELLFKPAGQSVYAALPGSYKPTPGIIECKFAPDNLRFDPNGSEFSIEFYNDVRLDVGIAVARETVSNVSLAVEE